MTAEEGLCKDAGSWNDFVDNLRKLYSRFDESHHVLNRGLRYGGMGLGLGFASGLYRELDSALDERKKKRDREDPKISPDTIVIRIPRKVQDEKMAEAPKLKVVDLDSDYTISVNKKNETPGKARDVKGRFAPSLSKSGSIWTDNAITRGANDLWNRVSDPLKTHETPGWNERANGIMASIAGGVGGFYLADAIVNKIQEKRLKKQIEAAQQSYFDFLDGRPVKHASFVNDMFILGKGVSKAQMNKEAMTPLSVLAMGMTNLPPLAIAGWNMSALASAYLTKKFLEDKFGKKEDEDEKPRKITRVVFKSVPPPEAGQKVAEERRIEISPEVALCAIQMMKEAMEDEYMSKSAGIVEWGTEGPPKPTRPYTPPTTNPMDTSAFLNGGNKPVSPNQNPWEALHGGLDWVLAQDGGDQWMLDQYAKTQGLRRDNLSQLPGGRTKGGVIADNVLWGLGFGNREGTLGPTEANALKLLASGDPNSANAAKSYMLSKFKDNPERFLTVLGDKRNSDLVNNMAMKGINSMFGTGGKFEWLGRIPVLGNLARTAMGYFARNTGWAKRMGLQSALPGITGWSNDRVSNLLGKYDFHGGGNGWSLRPQQPTATAGAAGAKPPAPAPVSAPAPAKKAAEFAKSSGLIGDVMALSSRSEIIGDVRNSELSSKLDSIIAAQGKPKRAADKKTNVSASDPDAEKFVSSNKDKIKNMIRVMEEKGFVD